MKSDIDQGIAIRVSGTVQGVGFRPTVWRLAMELGIRGEVWNDARGVAIHAWGDGAALDVFLQQLKDEAPPLAVVEGIDARPLPTDALPPAGFRIVSSRRGEMATGIAADAAICAACAAEIRDPGNRRYRYPFTNCTHCGPRLSIVRAIPYDRANTSMALFPMCSACQAEYDDPADRRFHAQPNACPECGPHVWLEDESGRLAIAEEAMAQTAALIRQGRIVAIKGIGGFHLACDAVNEAAVMELRRRKKRYGKAFALMAADVEMVKRYARVSENERAVLESSAAPVVILDTLADAALASGIAPAQNTLGFMLPYSPLHHLLMGALKNPIVLTSGNRSHEPQCVTNEEARERLGAIADAWLMHDREILNRVDDSVIRVAAGRPRLVRRARGYAPAPLPLPEGLHHAPPILAMGGELKNTFCLLRQGRAVLSQHIGDLEDAATLHDYRHNLGLYRDLYRHAPQIIVVDRHPDYLSTQLGRQMAGAKGLELSEVQHHHAHIAACLAEHAWPVDGGPVLGIALDGLGYGDDGVLWGGEFLAVDYREFHRLGHFAPVPMPGGVRAMQEPWRNTWAHLETFMDWERLESRYGDMALMRFLRQKPLANLRVMAARGLNTPASSSCGRLFDAVSAAIGICREEVLYEGQAAIELEAVAATAPNERGAYPFQLEGGVLSWAPLWEALLEDLERSTPPAVVAMRFHRGLADAVCALAGELCVAENLATVVLGGGVFQNRLLLELVVTKLEQNGLQTLVPERLPANDGGLSIGQAVVAASRFPGDSR